MATLTKGLRRGILEEKHGEAGHQGNSQGEDGIRSGIGDIVEIRPDHLEMGIGSKTVSWIAGKIVFG